MILEGSIPHCGDDARDEGRSWLSCTHNTNYSKFSAEILLNVVINVAFIAKIW
jgi:hypothetical protein